MATPQKRPGVQVLLRLSAGTKDALDKACAENHTNLSGEVTARLKRTFAEDRAQGGGEMQLVTGQLVAAFRLGGRLGAIAHGLDPDGTEWLRNPVAFDVALANLNETAKALKDTFARASASQSK
jgi:hypothetical protein